MIGISRQQWELVAAALTLGGNVRVGLEDNFYLPDGEMARSNGDLVARARRMCEDVGRRPATVAEARERSGAGAVSGALEGIRVLDLSRLLPGGFCSGLLADFGADVLKVEDTGLGDYVRWAPPRYEGAERARAAALFLALNRNKRSIRIDLKSERGREVLLRLVRESDVLLEGFRPGVMERLGVGYERAARGEPAARLLRDHRLRAGRAVPRPLGPRHELPRPRRAARPDRREEDRRCSRRARSPTSAAAR